MADVLLVHDMGHGAWCWGRVWGHLTAPTRHPPRLYERGRVGKVLAVELPTHVARPGQDPVEPSLEDYAASLAAEVQSKGLRDLIMVGHGMAAPLVLHAAAKLAEPPRRVVLLAGVLPREGKSLLDTLPRVHRMGFSITARLSRLARKEVKLPKMVITRVYCGGMDPFDMIQVIGRFSSLPMQFFRSRVFLDGLAPSYPISYISLWRDALLPSHLQKRMAERLGGVELAGELDACHEVMIERPRQVADLLIKYA
jgi:pimeloyl-ACP methyl ester carboxylesterase